MKIFRLCLLVLTFCSCSQQDDLTAAPESSSAQAAQNRSDDSRASNSANPYDLAGQVHDELFASYFAQSALLSDISEIALKVETLATRNSRFNTLTGAWLPRTTSMRTQALMGHETCAVTDAISGSSLGIAAKSSLAQFTNTLLSMNGSVHDYDSFYTFIETYESGVLNDLNFTVYEKERLLTVASICRYSTYRGKKKPKKNTDPEWDHIVFSLAGGIDGGERSAAESVINALTAGIVQNK